MGGWVDGWVGEGLILVERGGAYSRRFWYSRKRTRQDSESGP